MMVMLRTAALITPSASCPHNHPRFSPRFPPLLFFHQEQQQQQQRQQKQSKQQQQLLLSATPSPANGSLSPTLLIALVEMLDTLVNVNVALGFDDSSHNLSQKYRFFRFTSGLNLDMGSSAEYEEEEEDDDHPSVLDLCLDIYSSETGQWVKSKASFKRGPYFALLDRPTVLLDGAIFLSGAPIYVLRFDIEEERFDFIRLPDDLRIPVYTRLRLKEAMTCLGLCGGRLHYACHNWSHLQLRMFDDCEPSKWVLKHGVELEVFRSINPTLVDDRMALDVLGLEEDPVPSDILAFHPCLDAVFVRALDGFYWYHAQSRKLDTITRLGLLGRPLICGFVYTASTHSQNGIHSQRF